MEAKLCLKTVLKIFLVAGLLFISTDGFAQLNKKITELTEDTTPTSDDLMATVDSPASSATNKKVTLGNLFTSLQQAATGNTSGWVESPTERVRLINQNGRVGIGTSTPNEQLEITGNFRLSTSTATTGNIYKDGDTFIHDFGTTVNDANFFAGRNAGNLTLTSAAQNVAIGELSGNSLTTGQGNTLLGEGAGQFLTDADTNVIIGEVAGGSCIHAQSNVFIGNNSGDCTGSTAVYGNVSVGDNAFAANILGERNVAIGPSALGSTTLSENNTGVGSRAGAGLAAGGGRSYNTFF